MCNEHALNGIDMNYYILDTDTKTVGAASWGPLELNEPLELKGTDIFII